MINTFKTFASGLIETVKSYKSDWNVNDSSSPNYVKNRTHWKEEKLVELLSETAVEATAYGYHEVNGIYAFSEGQTYYITYDGAEYECVARNDGYDAIYVGNQQIMRDGNNWDFPETIVSDEPFFIFSYGGAVLVYVPLTAGTHTFSIKGRTVTYHKIDEKYLPTLTLTGKIVEGESFVIGGNSVRAYEGAEIFNDYDNNVATGFCSHSEGSSTCASEDCSHAEGYSTVASGSSSHAEGYDTSASGRNSHAEGYSTVASGDYSHAEGHVTTASGDFAHAEGASAVASGDYSHAEGYVTTASGDFAHAEGWRTTASGDYSHAEGLWTKASSSHQHVQGIYNINDAARFYAHIVGNGTSDTNRSNAHTLTWGGVAWYAGNVYVGGTSKDDVNAKKLATEVYVDNAITNGTAQADWSVYDDTNKAHIFNRPFYKDTIYGDNVLDINVALPYSWTRLTTDGGTEYLVGQGGFHVAETLNLNETYECHFDNDNLSLDYCGIYRECESGDTTYGYIGNIRLLYDLNFLHDTLLEDTGEDFCVAWDINETFTNVEHIVIKSTSETTSTNLGANFYLKSIKLFTIDLKLLDEQYLPSTVPVIQTAEVGQTVVVKAVDENGKPTEWEAAELPAHEQADWNQNDETQPDYVKNRTHYAWTETVDIVPEQTVYIDAGDSGDITMNYELTVGNTYSVHLNGETYEGVAWFNDDEWVTGLGNGSLYDCEGFGEDVPFLITDWGDGEGSLFVNEADDWTISVTGNVEFVSAMDEKFLPDPIVNGAKYFDFGEGTKTDDEMVEMFWSTATETDIVRWGRFLMTNCTYAQSSTNRFSFMIANDNRFIGRYFFINEDANGIFDLANITSGEYNSILPSPLMITKGVEVDSYHNVNSGDSLVWITKDGEIRLFSSTDGSDKWFTVSLDDSGVFSATDEDGNTTTMATKAYVEEVAGGSSGDSSVYWITGTFNAAGNEFTPTNSNFEVLEAYQAGKLLVLRDDTNAADGFSIIYQLGRVMKDDSFYWLYEFFNIEYASDFPIRTIQLRGYIDEEGWNSYDGNFVTGKAGI